MHLLIKIALLTWGVYEANRRTAHSMLSKTHTKKAIVSQFSRSKVIDCVGELLKALEGLALIET
jgi:hypothetical protein